MLSTVLVLMETGPIGAGPNELLYGIATMVVSVGLVVAAGFAVLLIVRHHRQHQARLSAVEKRLAALEQSSRDGVES